jgi:hypothetical protein
LKKPITTKGLVDWLKQQEHIPSKHEALVQTLLLPKKKRKEKKKVGS